MGPLHFGRDFGIPSQFVDEVPLFSPLLIIIFSGLELCGFFCIWEGFRDPLPVLPDEVPPVFTSLFFFFFSHYYPVLFFFVEQELLLVLLLQAGTSRAFSSTMMIT